MREKISSPFSQHWLRVYSLFAVFVRSAPKIQPPASAVRHQVSAHVDKNTTPYVCALADEELLGNIWQTRNDCEAVTIPSSRCATQNTALAS